MKLNLILIALFGLFQEPTCEDLQRNIKILDEHLVRKNFAYFYKKCPKVALTIPCFLPLKDFNHAQVSSGFGTRKHPISGISKHHNGIDIACSVREVVATATGIIKATGYDTGLGYFVVIDHQNSYETTYGHLSKISVQEGQPVTILETIGMVGSSGASTGNHIHYEIRKNGILVNPIEYLLLVTKNLLEIGY